MEAQFCRVYKSWLTAFHFCFPLQFFLNISTHCFLATKITAEIIKLIILFWRSIHDDLLLSCYFQILYLLTYYNVSWHKSLWIYPTEIVRLFRFKESYFNKFGWVSASISSLIFSFSSQSSVMPILVCLMMALVV